ncbi:hypothetical protein G8A07_18290 [Roseateles sp. DAIF2]|uniref:FliH/SctL family protein n=1 Tax=Roseateles sp. DAIF2 TaxID=2714952 RepID=UPI0018A2F1FF|nr:hypothetical protein [Roseateles sp. DAIF2]QPF74676.1 hypothetical protein G8A07_18290 [Roseateles sp. DAIF2]
MTRGARHVRMPQVLKGLRLTTLARSLPYRHEEPTPNAPANATVSLAPKIEVEAPVEASASDAQLAVALAEAERAGYQQGLANGRKEAQQELAREKDALARQAEAHEAERQRSMSSVLAQLEQQLEAVREEQRLDRERLLARSVELAFEGVCLLLGRKEGRREMLLQLIGAALDRWTGAALPMLRIGEDDHALLLGDAPEPRLQALLARVTLVVDRSMASMKAHLEDDEGGVDIGMETQLQALRNIWNEAVADARAVEPSVEESLDTLASEPRA